MWNMNTAEDLIVEYSDWRLGFWVLVRYFDDCSLTLSQQDVSPSQVKWSVVSRNDITEDWSCCEGVKQLSNESVYRQRNSTVKMSNCGWNTQQFILKTKNTNVLSVVRKYITKSSPFSRAFRPQWIPCGCLVSYTWNRFPLHPKVIRWVLHQTSSYQNGVESSCYILKSTHGYSTLTRDMKFC